MQNKLKEILENAKKNIAEASSKEDIEKIRVEYLGKKGQLTSILKSMGKLSKEERPVVGKVANEVRENIEEMIAKAGAMEDAPSDPAELDKYINETLYNRMVDYQGE